MNTRNPIFFLLACLLSFHTFAQDYGSAEFVENKGQWDARVRYMATASNGGVFLHNDGFTILQHNSQDWEDMSDLIHGHMEEVKRKILGDKITVRSHAYKVEFIGANPTPQVVPDKPLNSYTNYFIGNDPSKWAENCSIFQAVTVKGVYPGVDVRYYSSNGRMKYDIIVAPGANLSKIKLQYKGVDGLQVKNGELLIKTSVGELKELSPYSYQVTNAGRKTVNAKFVVKGNEVSFDIKGYDPRATLVIDPDLVFSSFSGSKVDNWGFTATYGPDGSFFGGGIVKTTGFPVSTGAFQISYAGGDWDIGIIKLSPDGRNRIYATYIGGSDIEQPHSLVVDGAGNLILAGRSNSRDYPTVGGTGVIGSGGNYDIVVTKLNASGSALIGSKRIGGIGNDGVNIRPSRNGTESLLRNYGDDGRSEVIIDDAGNIYVASATQSLSGNAGDRFPIVGGFQTEPGGGTQDGVVLKLPPDVSGLTFSSFIGGSSNDAAYVLSLHPFNNTIYVGGGTESNNLPGPTSGTIGTASRGSIDGFVSIISNNGSSILKTTYLGTPGMDQVFGVQFDRFGFPYVMGQTTGDWPVQNAAWSQTGGKQFIAKLEQDLSGYVYSTKFGSGSAQPNISPVAFLVDRCENVYISGWGGNILQNDPFSSGGTTGLSVTPDAIKPNTDGKDFYFFVLKKNASDQLFGSFFGQNGAAADHVDGGTSRFDRNGVIYQAICANCKSFGNVPFPTTPGVWSPNNPTADACNLAMVKIAFNLAGVGSGVQSSIEGVNGDTTGCVPLTVDFRDTVLNAVSYEWQFGDGSPQQTTTTANISHTYNAIGTYQVMLVAIDSTSCNVRDTSYMTIKVGDIEAKPAFTTERVLPCDRYEFRFANTTPSDPRQNFKPNAFVWDFGDGTIDTVDYNAAPITHVYASPGTYKVQLHLLDDAFCNAPEFAEQIVSAGPLNVAFTMPDSACAPFEVVFVNESIGASEYLWDFGDGTTSTEADPTHTYTKGGVYTVKLTGRSPAPCFSEQTVTYTITIFDQPVADFTATPQPPQFNTPITFNNHSSADAVRFTWHFGDGDSVNTTSRQPVINDYNATGSYNACLIAYNPLGCRADTCKTVEALVETAIDVPNAFTPLSGDINSIVMPRAYGVAKMKFVIWNRWGQKMFETESRKEGWNGYYKGVLQPMDVYVYTLEATFIDGTKTTKKGDITLIR